MGKIAFCDTFICYIDWFCLAIGQDIQGGYPYVWQKTQYQRND